jgi:Tfp pilus assembly protein PilN
VGDDEKRAATLRVDADLARRSVDRAQLEAVAAAAREANGLIDARTFSWTELLNRLEATLPPEVRIENIRPITDREGRLSVSMIVFGHRAEDIEQFAEQLEKTGGFQHVNSSSETTNPQGLLEVVIEGRYLPSATAAAAPGQAAAPSAPSRPAREE